MEKTREIVRKSIPLKSTNFFEVLKLSVFSGYDNGDTRLDINCKKPTSPIEIKLEVDEKSDKFKYLVCKSYSVTQEFASRAINKARLEQRKFGDNIDIDVSSNTENILGTLVLAHLSPKIDFSFTRLDTKTIDSLKFLAMEHIPSDNSINDNLISVS